MLNITIILGVITRVFKIPALNTFQSALDIEGFLVLSSSFTSYWYHCRMGLWACEMTLCGMHVASNSCQTLLCNSTWHSVTALPGLLEMRHSGDWCHVTNAFRSTICEILLPAHLLAKPAKASITKENFEAWNTSFHNHCLAAAVAECIATVLCAPIPIDYLLS